MASPPLSPLPVPGDTHTGASRVPCSSWASSMRSGAPGWRSVVCLSKVCSTVPPFPKSLRAERAQVRGATRWVPPPPRRPQRYLWKVQVRRRVMSEEPFCSSRLICSRLGGLMLHSEPELPSMRAVTMSS